MSQATIRATLGRRFPADIWRCAVSSLRIKNLKAAYQSIFQAGTLRHGEEFFQTRLTSKDVKLKPKEKNIAGLQLADLLAHPASDLQGGKEIERAVAFIGAFETPHDLAVVRFDIAGLPLQGLDAGLLVHRNDQCVLGRIEIQAHNVGGLGGRLLVGTDAPRTLPLQTDFFVTQDAPHSMHRTVERRCHRRSVPSSLAGGWRLLQQRQHSVAEVRAINRFGPGARGVLQAGQTTLRKALPPLDDRVGTGMATASHLLDAFAGQTAQDDLNSFDHLPRLGPTSGQPFQFLPVLETRTDCGRVSCHAGHCTIYRVSLQVSTSNTTGDRLTSTSFVAVMTRGPNCGKKSAAPSGLG